MLLTLANVLYVLVAVAMIALILMQRGTGAAAGSGFGAGASATVFGARGASNFLSKATKWLAIVFFALSLGMAVYASRPRDAANLAQDLGVMGGEVPTAPAAPTPQPAPTTTVPSAPAAQPAQPPASTVPAAPTQAAPAQPKPEPEPTPPAKDDRKD